MVLRATLLMPVTIDSQMVSERCSRPQRTTTGQRLIIFQSFDRLKDKYSEVFTHCHSLLPSHRKYTTATSLYEYPAAALPPRPLHDPAHRTRFYILPSCLCRAVLGSCGPSSSRHHRNSFHATSGPIRAPAPRCKVKAPCFHSTLTPGVPHIRVARQPPDKPSARRIPTRMRSLPWGFCISTHDKKSSSSAVSPTWHL